MSAFERNFPERSSIRLQADTAGPPGRDSRPLRRSRILALGLRERRRAIIDADAQENADDVAGPDSDDGAADE